MIRRIVSVVNAPARKFSEGAVSAQVRAEVLRRAQISGQGLFAQSTNSEAELQRHNLYTTFT